MRFRSFMTKQVIFHEAVKWVIFAYNICQIINAFTLINSKLTRMFLTRNIIFFLFPINSCYADANVDNINGGK